MKFPQAINLTSVPNARELGGYRTIDGRIVKKGRLLRSGALNQLTAADQAVLVNEYQLTCIVDFRDQREVEQGPDVIPPGARRIFLPVIAEGENNPAAKAAAGVTLTKAPSSAAMQEFFQSLGGSEGIKSFMINTYRGIGVALESAKAYQHFFAAALEQDGREGSLLFHCTAGKDRTGIGAALLLTALGVDRETIMTDYLLTNRYLAQGNALAFDIPEALRVQAAPLIGVDEAYLTAYFEVIEQEYGTLDQYLSEAIGLKTDGIQLLKQLYTESKE